MIGNQNVLKLGSRSKIFNFIEENPGLHIREIGRRLDMPRGTVRYHVKYLKKAELIEEKYEVGYKRIYCVNKLSAVEKKLLKLLRQEIPCKIFLHLIFSISFSQIEISRELELSPPTVNYHLKKLMDINFIERAPVKDGYIHPFNDDRAVMENTTIGREVFYKRKDPKLFNLAWKLLLTHKNSFPEQKYVQSVIDWLKEVDENGKLPKKLSRFDTLFEEFVNTLEDIIPNPYHV